MKARLSVLSVLSIVLFTSAAWAMPIWQFDKMSDHDQNSYVSHVLVTNIENACQKEPVLDALYRFFAEKKPGEAISGMGKFELNLAYARIADLEAVARNPKVPRLQLEDVLYLTLVKNGIELPNHCRPVAFDFTPQDPPREQQMTLELARKELTLTQKWVARVVEQKADDDFFGAGVIHPPDQKSAGPRTPSQPVKPNPAVFSGFSSNDKAMAFFVAFVAAIALATSHDNVNGTSEKKATSGKRAPSCTLVDPLDMNSRTYLCDTGEYVYTTQYPPW